MMALLGMASIGFLLGMAHATDPDHLLAVTTIVNREGTLRRAALVGLAWGAGHTLTILLLGSAILLLGVVIPGPMELSMELSVSLMLIVLGISTLAGPLRVHPAVPEATGAPSLIADRSGPRSHPSRGPRRREPRPDRASLRRHLRPLFIGTVHGLAGSAAVALLVLGTIPGSSWRVLYLLVFGAGTMAGMTLFTLSLTSASRFLGARYPAFTRWMGFSSSLASLSLGIFLACQLLW